MTLELTRAQIKQVLEEQWQPAGASRPFLKLGINKEFTYTYDPTAAADRTSPRCGSTGPSSTRRRPPYLVGANSFLAAGGDNFFTLAQGTNKADSGKIDLKAMVDYFDEFGTVSPDFAQRAVGVRLSAGCDATRRASR